MANDEFKKLLDDALKPIQKDLTALREFAEITQDKVEKMELVVSVTNGQVRMIRDQQSVMNKKLEDLKEVKEIVEDRIYPSVVEIENTIGVYGDMYKINNDNSKKLDRRLNKVEKKLGIDPPPELSLAEVG